MVWSTQFAQSLNKRCISFSIVFVYSELRPTPPTSSNYHNNQWRHGYIITDATLFADILLIVTFCLAPSSPIFGIDRQLPGPDESRYWKACWLQLYLALPLIFLRVIFLDNFAIKLICLRLLTYELRATVIKASERCRHYRYSFYLVYCFNE